MSWVVIPQEESTGLNLRTVKESTSLFKRRRLSAPHVHESRDASPAEERAAISPRDLPQTALAIGDERANLGQPTSHGAAGDFQHDSVVEGLISPEPTVHQRSPARSPRRYRRQQGTRSPRRHRREQGARSQKSAQARFPESRCSVPLPNSDLSDSEVRDAALSLPSASSAGITAPQRPQLRSGSGLGLRTRKASKAHETKGKRPKKPPAASKAAKDYSPGAF